MLSNKMTFSLTSLIVCLMLSFVGNARGHGDGGHFSASLQPGELLVDVSTTDHADIDDIQVASGRDRATGSTEANAAVTDKYPEAADPSLQLDFAIEFGRVVRLYDYTQDTVTSGALTASGSALGLDDFTVEAFDDLQRSLGRLRLDYVVLTADLSPNVTGDILPRSTAGLLFPPASGANALPFADLEYRTPQAINVADPGELPGRQFRLEIFYEALQNAYSSNQGGGFEIHTLLVQLAHGAADDASLSTRQGHLANQDPGDAAHNEGPRLYRVDLVNDDEGLAQYATIDSATAATAVGSGVPGVVAIERVLTTSGIAGIADGPFDVRIVLTEEPAEFTSGHIRVKNGTPSDPVKLLSIPSGDLVARADFNHNNFPSLNYADTQSGAPAADNDNTNDSTWTAYTHAADTTQTPFPFPTGRDNMYHVYSVTITPNTNFSGNVTVSVGNFDDKVLPVPNRYEAMTEAQLLADSLSGLALAARNVRVPREAISVRVSMGEHPDRTALMAEWKKRDDWTDDYLSDSTLGLFNQSPHVREIGWGDHRNLNFSRLVIPKDGYFVLILGNPPPGQSGVTQPPWELKRKLTEAQKLYNAWDYWHLPEPAADLDVFFRNGGTLHLLYKDIPLSTTAVDENGNQIVGPTHDDTDHTDYYGYDGADSKVHTKGDILISEVMWGLDITSTNSQYIELHNTTGESLEIDPLEWVFVVGDIPSNLSDFTVIDTIGNKPDGKWWQVPGQSGVTASVQGAELADGQEKPVVGRDDLISMSRVTVDGALAADGTAQESWAASMRPSVNLSGRRIGTPGAANNYDDTAQKAKADQAQADAKAKADAAKAAADAAKAPVATASDLRITEIMVASSEGRLPQWIEITNVSAGAVSLNGWMVGIDNDSTDADVVASSLTIKLDGVTLGEGQSALVVSKAGRNSGAAARVKGDNNTGHLDSDRIVNAHSQIKPASKVYSMLSEMSFRISLEPPLPLAGGVTDRGDVVGNLGGGWELEMSEGNRSSLIRREMGKTAEIMGTDAAGWVLASETSLIGAYVGTYYGDKDDMGTPGYDAGGALPVELSKFGAKRDPLTGQVVITWETQSELNNAGFFIKRAEHKTAQFVPVNPTMIPGAGTTSEKQSYTYTDTTAKPNIVYYYQIEDVSLDGNRQTLTRAHRLKGHVGAAGKLTTMWGELKERE